MQFQLNSIDNGESANRFVQVVQKYVVSRWRSHLKNHIVHYYLALVLSQNWQLFTGLNCIYNIYSYTLAFIYYNFDFYYNSILVYFK